MCHTIEMQHAISLIENYFRKDTLFRNLNAKHLLVIAKIDGHATCKAC